MIKNSLLKDSDFLTCDGSFTWFLTYFFAQFLDILMTGSLEMGTFLQKQSVLIFEQLRLRCI